MASKNTKTKETIDRILKKILITKNSSGQGNASKELYKMRYGGDWKKFYPAVK